MITFISSIIAASAIFLAYSIQKTIAGPQNQRLSLGFQIWFAVFYALILIIIFCIPGSDAIPFNLTQQGKQIVRLFYIPGFYYLYLILSGLLRLITGHFYKKEEYRRYFALGFYQFQEIPGHSGHWGINVQTRPLRKMAVFVSRALLILSMTGMILISVYNPFHTALWYSVAALVMALICVYEFTLYLGGDLLETRTDSVKTDGQKGRLVSQYSKAARSLEQTFPEALLYSKEIIPETSSPSPELTLNRLEKSSKINDLLAATYFRSEQSGQSVNPDYIRASARLLDRKNTLIRNPFYRDLGRYIALPLNESLMLHRKLLIICPGSYQTDVVEKWIRTVLDESSHFHEKWLIGELTNTMADCNIGILKYSSLYDPKVMQQNGSFFGKTEYVLMLGPSEILSISQIGLSLLSDALKKGDYPPVYCILDKNLSGLKDTLSHVLKTMIDEDFVISDTPAIKNYMIWNSQSDFQSIERFGRQVNFLGGGVEIGAQTAAAGIPSAQWVSQSSQPVADLQDLAVQSYQTISRVIGCEPTQSNIRERIPFLTTPWTMEIEPSECLIVEDECFNPFQTASYFVSRGKDDVFINILSDNYYLRDYFCANAEVFLTNPNAIPSLVCSYVRSNRNVLFKLILMMLQGPVDEDEIIRQLDLTGIKTDDPLSILRSMLERYTEAEADLFYPLERQQPDRLSRPHTTRMVGLKPEIYDRDLSKDLKNICYVLEDEQTDLNLPNTMLYSQIVQKMLPGQFVNYGGRAYCISRISRKSGVVLSRASDLIDGRKFYNQFRYYHLPDSSEGKILTSRTVNRFCFSKKELNFSVDTLAYLERTSRNTGCIDRIYDLRQSPDFSDFKRTFKNKTVLSIKFPSTAAGPLRVLAAVLSQILPSLFPKEYPYLSVLAASTKDNPDSVVLFCDGDNLVQNELLIIEDSVMDLGLLDVIETHFFEILSIVQDVLTWQLETLSDTETVSIDQTGEEDFVKVSLRADPERENRLGLIRQIQNQIEEYAIARMIMEEDR